MTLAAAKLMSDAHEGIGRIGRIPVRNLWLLMLYASDLFRDLEEAKVAVENNPDDIPDLVSEMLCRQVEAPHSTQFELWVPIAGGCFLVVCADASTY